MKVIYNRLIPFGRNFLAINLFGVVFAKGHCDATTIRHESIHTTQMRELLYLPFYIWYAVEWVARCIQYGGMERGYRNISFEREAYARQRDADYLKRRRRFAFLDYLHTIHDS